MNESLLRKLLEEFCDVNWYKAPVADELEEFQRVADDLNLDVNDLITAYGRAALSVLDDAEWERLDNTDSWDVRNMIEVRTLCKLYDRDCDPIEHAIQKHGSLPAPIILRHGSQLTLVAGNTRLMCCRVKHVRPHVVMITV